MTNLSNHRTYVVQGETGRRKMSMAAEDPRKLSAFENTTTDFTSEMRSTFQMGKRELRKKATVSHEGDIGITNIKLNDTTAAEYMNSTKATTFYQNLGESKNYLKNGRRNNVEPDLGRGIDSNL